MKKSSYSKDIILVLTASFFYMASPMLVTPLITGFTESIGGSAGLMGIVGGMMNLCSLVCRPLAGNLADRISKYRLSLIGAVLMTAACGGYIAAPNALIVVVSRIINGVGFACCSVCMATWVSNMLPRNKIGSGMGFYGMMNALAMAVAPAIGVSAFQRFGYRISFCIALVFSIAVMIVIQFVGDKGEPEKAADMKAGLKEQEQESDAGLIMENAAGLIRKSGKQLRKENGIQLVDVRVLPIALIIMLFAIPYCATQSFLVTYASVREINVTVSFFFPSYAVILLLLRLVLKNYFDKLPFKVFLAGSSACMLLAILCLTVMNSNIVMFTGAFFLAGGYGIMSSVCQSTAMLLAGKENRGLANSTYYIGLDLGMALGPMIGGALYGGLDIRWFYPVLMLTVPLAVLVYLAAGKQLRQKQ
ncbi:MFS transporter [Lachnoclostridium sp. An169]|uniref:MFS transporter n=1 Tax=Lachnoclostridium sp. An169 TaxID=1965569 RepID=UPI0013A61323|nr:MFS transporter [Lachnoclostridium sp. An169]